MTDKTIKLEEGEKVIFHSISKKYKENEKVMISSLFDEKTKTYIININPLEKYLKITKNSKYSLKYFCEDCNKYFNKDACIIHLLNKKHYIIKEIEKKCDIHNKDLIYFDLINFKVCCQECNIINKTSSLPLLYKPSQIIYSNFEVFMGPIKNMKKEGDGITIYDNFTMFIGNYKNNFPQLPSTFMNVGGTVVEISEKWGDIREYKIVDCHKNDFLEVLILVLEKFKLDKLFLPKDFEVKVYIYYDINKYPWYKVYFYNIYFDPKRDNIAMIKYFILLIPLVNKWLTEFFPHIKINLLPQIKKGYSYDFSLFNFLKIVKDKVYSNENFSYSPIKLDNTDKYKILFIFKFPERDLNLIIDTQIKIESFNKNNNDILKNFLIYFIFDEKKIEIRNKISTFLLKGDLNVIYAFFEEEYSNMKDPINIFLYTKYLNKPFFLIFNGKNYKILKMGLIDTFERKFLDFKFPEEEKKIDYPKVKSDIIDFIYNKQKQIDYYSNLRLLIPLRLKICSLEKTLELVPISHAKLSMIGLLRENDLLEVKNELKKYTKEKNIKITKLETLSFDIENLKKECFNCKNNLDDNKEIYACFWCKIAFCEKCVEDKINDINNIGKEKLIHKEHNLLYFKTRNKEKFLYLDKLKLGKNLFNKIDEKEWTLKHPMICNGCGKSNLISIRYLCLSCRKGSMLPGGYIDYCYNCIQHLRNKDSFGFQYENIEDKDCKVLKCPFIKFKHKHDEDIYLCIIFNTTDDYFSF